MLIHAACLYFLRASNEHLSSPLLYPLLLWSQHALLACMSFSVSAMLATDAEQGTLYEFGCIWIAFARILISNDAWSFAVNQEEICKAAWS
jgi:tryptophan-rich sensory protein